ncbi:hypothetical protein N7522_006389 [Penicillium canescens]|nr:hypothetical protein N7522_006389 [Penicillium canescens]
MAAGVSLSHGDYTVGWICALPLEMAAAKLMLDAIHPSLPRPPTDQNTYILGNIGEHNIVIACLPSGAYGTVSAATVAIQLLSSFHSIRFGLMVGIGGGVPSNNADIRLGDIVVSQPADTSGGVTQYDLGKALSGGQFQRTGMLNRPPKVLLTALAALQAHHFTEDSRVLEFISEGQAKMSPRIAANFARPTKEDLLYQTEYDHGASDTCIGFHRFNIPIDLTAVPVIDKFVGRQDELDNLWQHLQPTNSPSRKVAILHGLGGMGKTQLAVRFARDHKDTFTAIFWMSGKDRDALLQSLSFALDRLPEQYLYRETISDEDVEQRARHMLRWLALDGNSRWLIIFDNIDQYSAFNSAVGDGYDISEFFPTADHGSILITSRLQSLTELGVPFPMHRLDSHTSVQLLLQSSGLSASNTESNPDILALTNRLDGLPLAIVVAGAFMRETGTSITEYLEYYQKSWYELQLQSDPGRQYQQGNMLQTWMISYCEIQKRYPCAADLLLLLARFDNRHIWYELVESGRHSSNVPDWLKKAISSGLAFKIAVKSLVEYSLLESKQQEGSYAMHPVVQDWCHHIASTKKNVNSIQLNELALISVGYTVPNAFDSDYSGLQQRLLPHANYVRHLGWSGDNIGLWGAFHGLGDLYFEQGKLREAEEMYQRALAGYEKAQGPDHTSTLHIVNNLGLLYSDQGKLKEAEEMYQRALAGYEKALGPDHTFTLDTVHNLGLFYYDQGKLKEAEEKYQRALAGCGKALGPDHTSTLGTVNNLGNLYKAQGKLKEAKEMYQRALAGYEKALGPDHTSTLGTVSNLGTLYFNQGKLKEAEEMYQRVLSGYEKALGPDHARTLRLAETLNALSIADGKYFDIAQEGLAKRFRIAPWQFLYNPPKFRKACANVHRFVEGYIKESKLENVEIHEKKGYGFIKQIAEKPSSIEELRDQLLNVLLGGRDTTACCLSWTLYVSQSRWLPQVLIVYSRLLVRNPQVMNRLRQEIASVMEACPTPTRDQIGKMLYLKSVIKESGFRSSQGPEGLDSRNDQLISSLLQVSVFILLFRLIIAKRCEPLFYQPGAVQKEISLCELVVFSQYVNSRKKNIYGPDAYEFRPERWESDELAKIGWAYIPFSGGPSRCLGEDFARMEISYTIVRMLQTFPHILLPTGEPNVPVGSEKQRLTLVLSSAEGCKVEILK